MHLVAAPHSHFCFQRFATLRLLILLPPCRFTEADDAFELAKKAEQQMKRNLDMTCGLQVRDMGLSMYAAYMELAAACR